MNLMLLHVTSIYTNPSCRAYNKAKHFHSLRSLGRAKDARPCLRRYTH
ncbi:hypothetical protein DFR28_1152 [Arenicella xantha]|uniref:Uncharacterized protein n=1 Tax=Arenicella xantha TaxID=644221 RepID=A0A395JH95_9GAMM|nr:hypothetical protein DFR28_1152 [Arenicella xantha]